MDHALYWILVAGSMLFGVLIGQMAARRRTQQDLALVERQIDANAVLAERQYRLQVRASFALEQRQRLQNAYVDLIRWLYSLERSVEEVWFGSTASDPKARQRAELLINEWHWEALRTPLDTVHAEPYWSSSIRSLLNRFRSTSIDFIGAANICLKYDHPRDIEASDRERLEQFVNDKNDMTEKMFELRGTVQDIKNQVQVEVSALDIDID